MWTISVFGSARPKPGEPEYETAMALGRAIAEQGWTLCNGGYGGTMEAAARGAVDAGGHTIGVTCAALRRPGANRYIRETVRTRDLLERLRTLIERGDGYVVLPGGTGTLAELALVWEMRNKQLFKPMRTIVLLGDYWADVCGRLSESADVKAPPVAATVEEAIGRLRRSLSRRAAAKANAQRDRL
ncbi:MAG: LOG family protein [Planctomycetota bacterium]|nr:MAG: LOG family protein [Planctomycetota bacterium]